MHSETQCVCWQLLQLMKPQSVMHSYTLQSLPDSELRAVMLAASAKVALPQKLECHGHTHSDMVKQCAHAAAVVRMFVSVAAMGCCRGIEEQRVHPVCQGSVMHDSCI